MGAAMTRDEALAKAREETGHSEHWQNDYAERLLYEADFAEWLKLRAKEFDGADFSDEEADRREIRKNELMFSLLTRPVPKAWMIFHKFEIIEQALAQFADDHPTWGERVAIIAIACIKTEIMRFGFKQSEDETS